MPNFAAIAALLLFSGSAIAQISAPPCTYPSLYSWAYNSLNQNPCTVAAYLGSTCHSGSYTVYPLPSTTVDYSPTLAQADSCTCNTVMYSLISACSECQGALWNSWTEYSFNCTTVTTQPPSTFPNPVPSGTRVPQWALLNIMAFGDFDSVKALTTGDTPEISPGVLIGSTTSSTAGAQKATSVISSPSSLSSSSSSNSNSSPSSSSGGSKTPVGAIVGGVVGGIAVIAVVVLGIIYLRRQRPVAPSAAFVANSGTMPHNEPPNPPRDGPTPASSWMPETPISTMRLYNPDDSTTFPGYQGTQSAHDASGQQPPLPHVETGNTLATMQMSRTGGYNGLPTV